MSIITVEQIKAARALLNWNQQDLATAAQMSKPALANLERRTVTPRPRTLAAIERALMDAGIKFTENQGVRLRTEELKIQIWNGQDGLFRFWDDIYTSMDEDDLRYMSGARAPRFKAISGMEPFEEMLARFHKKGIKGYAITRDDNTDFSDMTFNYRLVQEDYFMNIPSYIYGDKYAIIMWEPEFRVVVIQNEVVANSFKKQFMRLWDIAAEPTKNYEDRF